MKNFLLSFLMMAGIIFLSSCSDLEPANPAESPESESVVDDAAIEDPLAALGSSNITFGIYAENIPLSVKWDINAKLDIWNGMAITEQTVYKGEGSKAWKFTGTGTWMGMGIRVNPLTTLKSMSAFSGGYLSFMFKGTKRFKIGIKSGGTTPVEKWIAMTNGKYGFYNNNTWCVVRLPLSLFSGVNLAKIEQYFMFAADSALGYVKGSLYYMDRIYWYKTVTYNTSSSSSYSISSSSSKSSSSSSKSSSSSSSSSVSSVSSSSVSSSTWGETWTRRSLPVTVSGLRWMGIAISTNGNKIAAASYGGYIYTSSDGGATWTERTSAETNYWRCIAMSADGTKLIASGNSLIYTSTDGGATWTKRTNALFGNFWNVAMSANGTKIAGVAYGTSIYISTDGGATWTEHATGGPRYLKGVAMSSDGTKIAVTGTFGNVSTSSDGGNTWTVRSGAGQSGSFIAMSGDGTKLAQVNYEVPYNGANSSSIFTSSDSGVTWTERTGAGASDWECVSMSKDGTKIVAVSMAGKLVTSSDSGVTWIQRAVSTSQNWYSIAVSGNGNRIAAGSSDTTGIYTCP